MVILFNSRINPINYSYVNTLEQIEGIVPPRGNTIVTNVHNYNTRLAAKKSYYLPYLRTSYGKFNMQFQAPRFVILLPHPF